MWLFFNGVSVGFLNGGCCLESLPGPPRWWLKAALGHGGHSARYLESESAQAGQQETGPPTDTSDTHSIPIRS